MSDFDAERFIYVKLPDAVSPLERGDKYEDPLGALLAKHGLGAVTGGGSQLGADRADGTPTIAFCGVDIEAVDRDAVRVLLRARLPGLGAPVGTEIHYTSGGDRLQDALGSAGWTLGGARTHLHPYFRC